MVAGTTLTMFQDSFKYSPPTNVASERETPTNAYPVSSFLRPKNGC